MAGFEYYNAKVYDIINETDKIRRFFIEFPELEKYEYTAGQYVKIDMPIDDKKTYRQYSIASCPDASNKIELLIVFQEGGKGTDYLFNKINVGSELKVSKALGRFVLPEILDKEICMICTGVGLAPFRGMYLDVLKNNRENKGIHLIFGTRNITDMCYPQELEQLAKEYPNFHYYPVLSRETPETWNGKIGYVHQIYKEIFADKRPALFYLCGWDVMIKEARKHLMEEMGYERRAILFEKYD